MARRRSVVLLSALAATTSLLATSACRKGAPADSRDASTRSADAAADAGASTTLADAAAAAMPVATTAPTSKTFELASEQPPPNPFTGTYRCFNGMKLEQAGRIVTSTMHKGTTDTVLACTAGGETCTGTVREIQMVRGKAPKVTHVKPVTLTLTKNGDVVYVVGSPEKKKAGRGDQTFCPRR